MTTNLAKATTNSNGNITIGHYMLGKANLANNYLQVKRLVKVLLDK